MFNVFANWKCRPNGTMKQYVPNEQQRCEWGQSKPCAHTFPHRIHRDDFHDYRQRLWSSIKRRTGFTSTYRFQIKDGYQMTFSCGKPYLVDGTYLVHSGFDLSLGRDNEEKFVRVFSNLDGVAVGSSPTQFESIMDRISKEVSHA